MSHEATNWAFLQTEVFQDMKPSEWAVLLVLANCHNPVNGCFPSQKYISIKTNQNSRTVRRQLSKLKDRKLIKWDETREDGRRSYNRYLLAFEESFNDEILPDKLPSSDDDTTGQNELDLPDKNDSFNRTNCPTKEVRETVTETNPPKSPQGGTSLFSDSFEEFIESWPEQYRKPEQQETFMRLHQKAISKHQVGDQLVRAGELYRGMEISKALTSFKSSNTISIRRFFRCDRFLEFCNNPPPINEKGFFEIKPSNKEWDAWIEYYKNKYAGSAASKLDLLKTPSRWPPK